MKWQPPIRQVNQKILGWLVVPSSSGASIGYLDGIRSVAVLFVLVRHAWWIGGLPTVTLRLPIFNNEFNFTPLIDMTSNGVDLFFVLSGFLLALPWMRADFENKLRPSLRQYFKQRFFRILPAYYVCLFLTLLFFTPSFIPPEAIFSQRGLLVLGMHLTLMQYNNPLSQSSYVLNGQFWTLTMECMFYLMVPWVVRLFLGKRWRITLPLAFGVAFGYLALVRQFWEPILAFLRSWPYMDSVATTPQWAYLYLSKLFPVHVVAFSAGITLANFYARSRLETGQSQIFRRLTSPMAGLLYFFGGWFFLLYMMNKLGGLALYYQSWTNAELLTDRSFDSSFYYYLERVPFGVAFGLIIAGLLFGGRWVQAVFSILPLRFVGIVGYSVYLWHVALLFQFAGYPAINKLPTESRFPALLAVTIVAVLVLSTASYLLVEKPFMLLARRRKSQTVVPLPAVSITETTQEMVSKP